MIIGAQRSDAGMYTCIADNGIGASAIKQTQLSVKGKSFSSVHIRSSFMITNKALGNCLLTFQLFPSYVFRSR